MQLEEIATKKDLEEMEKRILKALGLAQKAADNGEKYYTTKTAAAYLQMRPQKIGELVRAGEISHIRDGRLIKFSQKDLDKYMNDRRIFDAATIQSKAFAIGHV